MTEGSNIEKCRFQGVVSCGLYAAKAPNKGLFMNLKLKETFLCI